MMSDQAMKKVEEHLRTTSRQLIKFDTEEEALQYLTDSFRAKFNCDLVGVILIENGKLTVKAWSGIFTLLKDLFPLPEDECREFLDHSMTYETAESLVRNPLLEKLKQTDAETWFTVPLIDENQHFGFCIVSYLYQVPLLDMNESFDEFGKDVASVMRMVRRKEAQLKKIKEFEWFGNSLSLDVPLEQHYSELTTRAGVGTKADFACIYLYNEKENGFVFQPPSYGEMEQTTKIDINEHLLLEDYFPFLERIGGKQLTIPLIIDLKPVGVLHIENKKEKTFTKDDLDILAFLAKHFTALLENVRLYNNEKDRKDRLQCLLEFQQDLIKETAEDENFDGITSMLYKLFQNSVILFNPFMQPISIEIQESEKTADLLSELIIRAKEERMKNKGKQMFTVRHPYDKKSIFAFWLIKTSGRLLGYMVIERTMEMTDEFDQLTIDVARNICSIQFIKQMLVLDAKEQEKDEFIGHLLTKTIENKEKILQYASLLQWDPFRSHQIAVMSLLPVENDCEENNFLKLQIKKSQIWAFIKKRLTDFSRKIITASYEDGYILIAPNQNKDIDMKKFWGDLFKKMKQWIANEFTGCTLLMGVGGTTAKVEDYYESYQQALQALKVVGSRFQDIGFSFFEELGSYVILHHLEHTIAVDLFVKKQLEPLISYSKKRHIDLCHTLHVFLKNNGNVKNTAKDLYMHRSSLLYRLEKIQTLLSLNLSDSEVRFNLMMALKLYDMYGEKVED